MALLNIWATRSALEFAFLDFLLVEDENASSPSSRQPFSKHFS